MTMSVQMNVNGGFKRCNTLPPLSSERYHGEVVEWLQDNIETPILMTWNNNSKKWEVLNSKAVEPLYQNKNQMLISVGGYNVGTSFDTEKTIQQMLTGLLYPYVKPTLTFTTTPNTYLQEIGTSINNVQLKLNIVKQSSNIIKTEYYKNNALLYTDYDSLNYNISYTDMTGVNQDTTYYCKVYDDAPNSTDSNRIQYKFVYPIYVGGLVTTSPTETDIKGLNKLIQEKANIVYPYTIVNSRFVISFPQSYGVLSKAFDTNGFDITNDFTLNVIPMTIGGMSTNYNVYVYKNIVTVSNFNVQYKF